MHYKNPVAFQYLLRESKIRKEKLGSREKVAKKFLKKELAF